MSSSAGIYVCALTSACGLQGPFSSAASCPFNKGALDEHYVGCWSCTSVCCCRCLDLVSTKAKEFKHFHAELEVDPAASKSLLAVLDGRGARAAVDADTRQELQADGVGSFDEAAGAAILCSVLLAPALLFCASWPLIIVGAHFLRAQYLSKLS